MNTFSNLNEPASENWGSPGPIIGATIEDTVPRSESAMKKKKKKKKVIDPESGLALNNDSQLSGVDWVDKFL